MTLPEGVQVFERGWLSSNNVLFVGKEGCALVDSGYCMHSAQTLELIEAALDRRPLDFLLNTHLHSDHCGGNAALQSRYPELQTLIPPGMARYVEHWDPVALTYVPTGQQCPQFRISGVFEPGAAITLGGLPWDVLAAPGHDPHSIILFEPKSRTLISADAFWEDGFGVVFPELEGQSAFEEVAATLDVIESLHPLVVIPGHGRVFSYGERSLSTARRRLEGFAKDPARHARHAAKVLLKFKLLELQQLTLTDFTAWALVTPYFTLVQQRWFPDVEAASWVRELAFDLARSGAARLEADTIFNA